MRKINLGLMAILVLGIFGWFVFQIYFHEPAAALASAATKIEVEVKKGETAAELAERLRSEGMVISSGLFRFYLQAEGADTNMKPGVYSLERPLTISRLAQALVNPVDLAEKTVTIIPGWDLRDVAAYFEKQNIEAGSDLFSLTGAPGEKIRLNLNVLKGTDYKMLDGKPADVGLEGYLAPDTYQVFADAKLEDVVNKLLAERQSQFTPEIMVEVKASGHNLHEILTMASLIEREVQSVKDKAVVSDILWRRAGAGWLLQADSTVHYAVGKKGSVFTTQEDREVDSLWNTYKYKGLPPGPICNPSFESVLAAIRPEKNSYWYFLTTPAGEVKYAHTLDEHNANVWKFLR